MSRLLLQLDANLIEGEPYNQLAQLKNERRLKWRDKIQIYRKYGKLVFKARQNKWRQWGPVRCHGHTDFFTSNGMAWQFSCRSVVCRRQLCN